MTEVLHDRRANPEGDLLERMLGAGDDTDGFTHEEIVDNAVLLFFAGFDTTRHLIASGCAALLADPDERVRLWRAPGLVPTAVEEFLRFDGPVRWVTVMVLEAVLVSLTNDLDVVAGPMIVALDDSHADGSVPYTDAARWSRPLPKENGMNREELAHELSASGVQELLASTSAAHLAYTATDGTPRVITVGFYWTGEEFVLATATTSPKVAALSARPEVALVIDAGDTPGGARSLSVRGKATVDIIDGVVPEYLAAARRTMDDDAAAQFERNVRRMYHQMARIAIVPTWVRFYDFGAGRMPRFLQELADQNQMTATDWAD